MGTGASLHCFFCAKELIVVCHDRTSESVQPSSQADNFSQDLDTTVARKRTKVYYESVDDDASGEDECDQQHHKKTKLPHKQFLCTIHGKWDVHPALLRIIDTPEVCSIIWLQSSWACGIIGHRPLLTM